MNEVLHECKVHNDPDHKLHILMQYYLNNDLLLDIGIKTKIANINNSMLNFFAVSLTNITSITQWFSFYTDEEMKEICEMTYYNYYMMHNDKNIKVILIYRALQAGNINLFNFLFDYMVDHSISAIIAEEKCQSYTCNYNDTMILLGKNPNIFYDHERHVIHNKSLRAAWITSCIIIIEN